MLSYIGCGKVFTLLLHLYAVSFTGTTAGDVPPSDSALENKLQDYIPVLVALPVLFVFLTSVITVAVIVTVKIK